MIEITIGLGIALSLILSETLGVTAGGIIVPGYIALYLHQPLQIVITFIVAVIVVGMIKLLSQYMFIYGKRRMVLALILGFLGGYISRNFIFSPIDNLSLAVIGNIIPGLIASWMDRQGIIRTISVVIITAVIVKLTVMLISGGELNV
ncbi:MAG: poly-gamma-glutamate biosynthesis protein PgsC [Candidatus Marinimicrobia bacterium]|nr:poly-gamma-glutamate biosynthesis protein PgsC [Candidatus Neomarinimicrobiota bacterium]